ncbi:MAG: pyruvate:ferredoxin (flavodoxin) oxidoreductase [Caldithrix sp.]|nr:pyruvate:ferredoxin (flavodoxin) oxidoreductase [Caldithrix sp.]
MQRKMVTIDGNEAAASVAHKINEVIAIYPITPSSPMGELADELSSKGEKNIWGTIPDVTEMQSEGGASGAVHGALQTGALTTTFTASQGLLLMIPNMYKIAGELTPSVFHVSARSVAAQALSIFGDHTDVMAVRQTGFGLIASNSIQEIHDFALISQAASLESRIPFVHFFDGFRSSHEVQKIEQLSKDDMREMIDDESVMAHRKRALTPDNPVLRGTAQNPDVFFQGRETVNPYYQKAPEIVQNAMDRFAKITGRQYKLFDYVGDPEAERVIVLMGSGAETAHEAVEYMTEQGEKVGAIKVRLYRPFSIEHLMQVMPSTVKSIAVLDRTKEPGAAGEPLYQDMLNAFIEAKTEGQMPTADIPKIIGGRYGLSSKEFTPAMIKTVFDELKKDKPKNHFTIGIKEDVTHSSLEFDPSYVTEGKDVVRGMFYGLGADGTVGANKNSIKIIGEETENFAQGYFVYDSKKSGSMTISHLRFGKHPIHSTYLITRANFVACHQFVFLEKMNVLEKAEEGATFLLNSPYDKDETWAKLPHKIQQEIIDKKLKFYAIDGYKVAKDTGMGARINTIMQTCFFAISGVLPKDEAIAKIKGAIEKTYGKKGEKIVKMNFAAVDQALDNLYQIDVPDKADSTIEMKPAVPAEAPEFVQDVTATLITGKGDDLPVSKMPVDGTFPTATTQWEKRNVALEVPIWDEEICIQCNKCVNVCPHSVIRAKAYDGKLLENAPSGFKAVKARGKEWPDNYMYTLQVAVEDCTGCELCVEVCPVKNKQETGKKAINMAPQIPIREQERENWDFFLELPDNDRSELRIETVKGSQFLRPLFEFSGACPGCGETPYVKLASQLFGDRMIVANATGCSSIYGGNLPTTPWAKDNNGKGPSWSNSLFEDNAEFGLGFRLTIDKKVAQAKELLKALKGQLDGNLVDAIINSKQDDEAEIAEQRNRVEQLKESLNKMNGDTQVAHLKSMTDYLVKKSVWIMGGDGWAYDIGYGGLDHVIASGKNVNILVMDTEVYSNTGGQMSKATPTGAVAKFAAGGKPTGKKDLGMQALSYGNVYVARVAMGANDTQTLKAFIEAERYEGPSLIIAYTHCIAHGYNLKYGMDQQKLAVDTGHWIMFRYNPVLIKEGKNPLTLDSKEPSKPLEEYMYNETRFKMVQKMNPTAAKEFLQSAQQQVKDNWRRYENLKNLDFSEES